MQDIKNNQLNLEVHDIYNKDGKITTTVKAVNDAEVANKARLDEKQIKNTRSDLIFRKNFK